MNSDGKPIGAEDFLKHLFEKIQLPSILGSEEGFVQLGATH